MYVCNKYTCVFELLSCSFLVFCDSNGRQMLTLLYCWVFVSVHSLCVHDYVIFDESK